MIERKPKKKKLALLIPAHNESMVISDTIASAMRAGLSHSDIYVVDDASSDDTYSKAVAILGKENVTKVKRSGKGRALHKAIKKFRIKSRYLWMHISDADGVFDKNYFKVFLKKLNHKKYVAATGHIKSLKGDWVSKFRVYEYTYGFVFMRRIQQLFGVILVMPGPTSCFQTKILSKLDFTVNSLTEDLDLTYQIHRKKIGKILYVPKAKTYTQDPANLRDYWRQVTRWYRGFFQAVRKYRVGIQPKKQDLYFLIINYFTYSFLLVLIPLLCISPTRLFPATLALFFVLDVSVFFCEVLISAMISKRWDILTTFPLGYLLKNINLIIYFKSFVEVMIFQKFKNVENGWETEGRRYQISLDKI